MHMNARITEKIKLWGIVQGVGFRPFVAKCADKYGIKGEVLNIGGLVDIIVTDTKERIDAFVEAIKREKPAPAEIVHIKREVLGRENDGGFREFDSFTILRSDAGDDEAAMIPADLSICPDCLAELEDEKNPRYRHPFISCMVCGPRYTVIDRIPYDRENTAMIDWPMCEFCEGEYTDRNDRRYHAQTISCHECGPYLRFRVNGSDEEITKDDEGILAAVCELLHQGKVLAMKGVGGYNLIADPFSAQAVKSLREIKMREQKPFAVMFRDTDEVKKFCRMSKEEENLIKSSAKPIILLEHKSPEEIISALGWKDSKFVGDLDTKTCGLGNVRTDSRPDLSDIEKSRFIGSFLPSMGAQYMLLKMYGRPLIVTSANLSDMPIIKDDEEMFLMMSRKPLIAACLYNERDIRVRVDDSVVRVIDGQPQMIRRSKGYAPVPLFIADADTDEEAEGEKRNTDSKKDIDKSLMILAAGGQLKNSFALSKGQFSYVSQYFGDLDSAENRALYEKNVERMKELFRIEPCAVACDLHPLYYTTQFAEHYAQRHANSSDGNEASALPIIRVQHHHAHVASVMAEHNINDTVIGVSMDGTGYGTDGNIWGGEFLVCRRGEFERAAHIKYVNMIGGDGSMKEAWKSAMCYLIDHSKNPNECIEKREAGVKPVQISVDLADIYDYAEKNKTITSRTEWPVVQATVKSGINGLLSSSMGRMFDAVSALLGIKDYNEYEGQCAMMLEDAAARAQKNSGVSESDDLALLFHKRIAKMIAEICHSIRAGVYDGEGKINGKGVNKVAITGGVFQNRILTELTLELLRRDGFETYYNISVSPNDGGIALGQNYVALCRLQDRH